MIAVALGLAPAALAIIVSTVNALKGMNPDSSWLTIFSRESQKAKIARFQIGLVEQQEAGDISINYPALNDLGPTIRTKVGRIRQFTLAV